MKPLSSYSGAQWLLRMHPDKQDTLLKLAILTMAAILCKTNWLLILDLLYFLLFSEDIRHTFRKSKHVRNKLSFTSNLFDDIMIQNIYFWFQPFRAVCFPCWGLRALFTSSIPTSTTERHDFWQRKDFISFTTGLMTAPGTHWVVSSAGLSTLVRNF